MNRQAYIEGRAIRLRRLGTRVDRFIAAEFQAHLASGAWAFKIWRS